MFDLTKTELEGNMMGGLIQCMETDPKGKHLAVMFQDTSSIAVFSIVRQPNLQLIPGYVYLSSLVIHTDENRLL